MPACAPVSETAGTFNACSAMAVSAMVCLFAGGQQHVHLAFVRQRHDFLGQLDQIICHAAHGRNDDDDLVALGAIFRPRAPATFLMRSGLPTDVPPYF